MLEEQILSASRIKTLESCSWKYWCNYELKLPKTKNDGNVRGNACHLALELLVNPKRKKYVSKIKKANTIKCIPSLVKVVKRYLCKNGFLTDENYEMCDDMIVLALNLDFFGGKGAKISKPEEEFFLDTTKNPDKPSYKMRGYIDKPIQYPRKKSLKIVDYKTNKEKFAELEVDYNPQAFAYLLAAKQIWPKLTDTSIQFQFLKFPDDPFIEIKYSEEQLAGFEYYLEDVYNRINNFTEKDAKSDFAATKGFPKDEEGFVKRLSCGFADYKGHLKKDGTKRWFCEYKFAYDYYAVVDQEGNTLYSSKNKDDLHPEKNQKIEKKHYAGCPAWADLNPPDETLKKNNEEDLGEFPF